MAGVLVLTAAKLDATELIAICVMFALLLLFNIADEARFFGLIDFGRRVMYGGLAVAAGLLAMAVLLGPTAPLSWTDRAIAQVEASR